MGVLVVHLKAEFPSDEHLLRIARLRQRLGFNVTQRLEADVVVVDEVGRIVDEAVRDDLQRAEVGDVHVVGRVQLVAISLLEAGGVTRETGYDHLVGRTNEQLARSATGRVGRLHSRLNQRLGQRTSSTGNRRRIGGRDRERTRTRTHGTLRDPASKATGLTGNGRRTGIVRAILDQTRLGVTLQFLELLRLLVGDFRLAARLIDDLFGIRDHEVLGRNLAVVTPASGRGNGREAANVITFQLGVIGRSGEGVGLPFEEARVGLGLL